VVHAEAHGSGYEAHLLAPLLEATRATFADLEPNTDVLSEVKVTADSGFHSRAVVLEVEQTGADAYIADRDYRRRDPAFATAARHKERDREERRRERRKQSEAESPQKRKLFTVQDFVYDEERSRCICPAGHGGVGVDAHGGGGEGGEGGVVGSEGVELRLELGKGGGGLHLVGDEAARQVAAGEGGCRVGALEQGARVAFGAGTAEGAEGGGRRWPSRQGRRRPLDRRQAP
jgi:hypothetical protein